MRRNCGTTFSSTVSQAPIVRRLLHERVVAWASVERSGEGDCQSLSQGGDRVLEVTLGSEGAPRGSWTTGKDKAFPPPGFWGERPQDQPLRQPRRLAAEHIALIEHLGDGTPGGAGAHHVFRHRICPTQINRQAYNTTIQLTILAHLNRRPILTPGWKGEKGVGSTV